MLRARKPSSPLLISPGVVAIELGHDITDPDVATALTGWRKKSLTPDAIARTVR